VTTGLPAALWSVVLLGALLNGLLTYLFWVENVRLHALLVAIMATFIALLIFLTAAMDNPFRGDFSVSSEAFETILNKVMTQTSAGS
jgi:ABC-type branched-subunit amino acid transport system permease subunit